jgi:hypothetical protein
MNYGVRGTASCSALASVVPRCVIAGLVMAASALAFATVDGSAAQQSHCQGENVRKVSSTMQRVIVTLKGVGGTAAQAAIAAAQDRLVADLRRQGHTVVVDRKFPFTPQIVLTVSAQAVQALRQNSSVVGVETDSLSAPQ